MARIRWAWVAGVMAGALALAAQGTAQPASTGLDLSGANVQFSGFGTLGLAATDTHQVEFRRDATQKKGAVDHPTPLVDTRLGLQLSSRLGEDLLATVQVMSRQRYDGTWRPDLQWASLTWTPGRAWEIRGGRLGLERLPNWDYANVGYTTLWVRPPVEVFSRQNFNYIDGLYVSRTFERADTTYVVALTGGFLDEKAPAAAGTYPLDLTDSEFWGAILKVRRGGFRGRATFGQLRASKNFTTSSALDLSSFLAGIHQAALGDLFLLHGRTFRNLMVGGAYERGPVQFQGAIQRTTSDQGSNPDSWSGFLSLGYRVGEVVPYGMYSRVVSRRPPDPDVRGLAAIPGIGPPLARLVTTAAHLQDEDQWTASAGLRWDFAPTADLKLQVDHVHAHHSVAPWVSHAALTGGPTGWDGKAMVFSVVVDFIFGGVR